jgi:hypothetical protein
MALRVKSSCVILVSESRIISGHHYPVLRFEGTTARQSNSVRGWLVSQMEIAPDERLSMG